MPPTPDAGPAGGVTGTLTKKVGPLPLWAYAVGAGGAALAFRIYTGGGKKKAGISSAAPSASPVSAGGGKPASVGGLILPESTLPTQAARTLEAAPVGVPALTVQPAPIVQPTTGTLARVGSPLTTTRTGGEGSIPTDAIIQYVNGVPISLSNYAVQHNISVTGDPRGALAAAGQGVPVLPSAGAK